MKSLRLSARLMPVLRTPLFRPVRGFASIRPFDDRERGEERVYFNKEDEKLLRRLLEKVQVKMKQQGDKPDPAAVHDHQARDVKALKAITDKFNISQEGLDAIVKWKYSS